MKLCIVCSAGGHLTEIMQLRQVFKKYDHFVVTARTKRTEYLKDKNEKYYLITDPKRSIIRYLKLICESFSILLKEKPDVIITTGAGAAVPICMLGKLIFNTKLIYIESITRIFEPSLSGKILYPISDLFLVQWMYLLDRYGEKAQYCGQVI